MSHLARLTRSRPAAAPAGLVLALSLVSVPAALAQEEGPDATILNLLTAIEAKDFEVLPTFFCEEHAAQAAGFDLSSLLTVLPEGTDAAALLDAFILDAEIETIEVLRQSDTEAIVSLLGTLSTSLDTEALAPFIESLLEASGEEVTPEVVEMMTGMLAAEFAAEVTAIDEEITLAPGELMPWLICDELGAEPSPEPSPSASPEPSPSASPEPSPSASPEPSPGVSA
jgi:hypothetical protein